ncbi:E4 SUMO-protein ligase PIAL2 isoform X2 [Cajanus cajan]|uniref:E4 SUMO-protein ligase PIAL2 isoform X2 n=1 Tax=Cajanus cajan TaxID=3821 RepID=UPI00098DBB2D|nr:E4 SUMO-protein ligase PIAL2 isoform X2 [Cajanus cajan]
MNTSSALPLLPDTSPSTVNMYRISKVADRLAWLAQTGSRGDHPYEFYNLCLSLSRGIDYAVANGENPAKAHDLPLLVKQICKLKNDELSQAAMMVLMISVKSACEIGWFQTKESEELVTIADEIGKVYSSSGILNAGPSSCSSAIPTIMEKFYPKIKLGPILTSIDAKPGYGAFAVDFHITKNKVLKDKIYLLVAQTDNIETSTCLISPQQVNFLLNGKAVTNRTNVQMDPGPQMPTNVTGMLKFGTNLLQAVGQFNSHYIVLVAYLSVASLPEDPVLQDYLQPTVTSVDSDSDIIEGASQISLNCPISFTRIKTPVKGRSCKHFQCFDFDNFISMNSKRPSWRCPHCNQYVCYADIRLDRVMVEILKNVGENITEVIVLADGSWKAVLEKDRDVDKMQNKAPNCEKEQTEPQESTCSPSTVDLTKDDDCLEIMDSCEIADRKPFQASVHSQFVTPNSTSLGMNSTGINQNVAAQIEDDFWSGIYVTGGSELPVLPDTVSPAFNQEPAGRDNNPVVNSAMHNSFSATNNLQMQLNHMNSVNEYGRSSSMPRINRTPVAVQALPVQSQALGPQQNSITNLNNSAATPHINLSNPASVDAISAILSDTERQQHFSRSPRNLPQVSGVNSTAFQHHSATQNPYRGRSFSEFKNPHLQQALNPRPPQQQALNPRPPQQQSLNSRPPQQQSLNSRPPPPTRSSNDSQWSHIQQGVSQSGIFQSAIAAAPGARQGGSQGRSVPTAGTRSMVSNQPARPSPAVSAQNQSTVTSTSFATDSFQKLTGEQRGNPPQAVSRPDELFSMQAEQNWVPTGRMRGSLDLSQHYDDSITQRIIAPTQQQQQNQSSRQHVPQPVRRISGPSQLDVLTANNRNANAHNRSSSR